MNATSSHEEISSVHVRKLFGRFDHQIEFPEPNNIAIITAPNGYGKTVMLKIIDCLFNRRLRFFREIDFEQIEVSFRSGKSVSISNAVHHGESDTGSSTVQFFSQGFGDNLPPFLLDDVIPSPEPTSIASRHKFEIRNYRRLLGESTPSSETFATPEWFDLVTDSINVHFVETQRLLSTNDYEEQSLLGREKVATSSVVERDAKDLAKRIRELLQEYANRAQKLDRTLPGRILSLENTEVASEDKIREDLAVLAGQQESLISVGLLEISESPPINLSKIPDEDVIRRILEIYVNDTREKLDIFDEMYKKIRLFKELLEARFLFKEIEIDPINGTKAIDKENRQAIPLSKLSSGEQHELVLVYELLFTVQEKSLILIDEPELSLHVLWQTKFIEDLQRIQELKELSVVIATHSPQIIDDKWELVQELQA